MTTLVLAAEDIRSIVRHVGLDAIMDELIGRLTRAFLNFDPAACVIPTRNGLSYKQPYTGLIEWMPIMETGVRATIKIVGYHPCNPHVKELPTIISTVHAYDVSTGQLKGLADATFLTALRTGAASAVASQYMASRESRVLAIIGCGAQSVTQLHALSRVFDLEQVLAYDVDPRAVQSFVKRTAFADVMIEPVDSRSLERLVAEADILCTATSVGVGHGPVFREGELKPWLHINAVGSDFPGKTEIPLTILRRAFVCPDFTEQAINEGECQILMPDEIGPDLVQLVQSDGDYEAVRQELTVFDSTGWALEDQVALEMLLDYAAELGAGTPIQIEIPYDDPRDPYYFVNGSQPEA